MKTAVKIKIGQQMQANKPIYLLSNGNLECGKFRYRGRYSKNFASFYQEILDLANNKPRNNILDVSSVQYWNAISMFDNYIVPKWRRSISTRKVEQFANETAIFIIIEKIKPEFKHALGKRWRWIFKRADKNDPNLPRKAWEIL